MREIQAPQPIPDTSDPKIFLAGSIEMGVAEEWQERVVAYFNNESVTLLNPRRRDWDASWKQGKDDANFRAQVEWELDALERSDHVIVYFSPETKSPISLLELGLFARSEKLLVVCTEGFWRKGNVDIVCEHYDIPQFATLEQALATLRERIGAEEQIHGT